MVEAGDYQMHAPVKQKLMAASFSAGTSTFPGSEYDHAAPLVIDPRSVFNLHRRFQHESATRLQWMRTENYRRRITSSHTATTQLRSARLSGSAATQSPAMRL